MSTKDEERWFEAERIAYEAKYLAAADPRGQSGFGRDECDWIRFRRPIAAAINKDGTFLDIGCANGLLMESLVRWAGEAGHVLEPYGIDISEKLAGLARQRLPQWSDRISVGNALYWNPHHQFDYVRTELVYVPTHRRRDYVQRLLDRVVADSGRLIVCSYGSSRPEGHRAEPLLDQFAAWNYRIDGIEDAVSPEYGFVITRVVWLQK